MYITYIYICIYIYIYICIYILPFRSTRESARAELPDEERTLIRGTPRSHSQNSLSKICSKGWVAQAPFFER